jgi:hypothetical protein
VKASEWLIKDQESASRAGDERLLQPKASLFSVREIGYCPAERKVTKAEQD